eukprot:TRINITY_DN16889_c0_g1_i1.p2 TRINITY_DN16889_c0_g1~~TRINITY_DN16889_c0_g1_i1.p2  ORF type:complete len:143 (+),score=39.46 TRINITY_DN16889_c0_g1_i1:61-429(+)
MPRSEQACTEDAARVEALFEASASDRLLARYKWSVVFVALGVAIVAGFSYCACCLCLFLFVQSCYLRLPVLLQMEHSDDPAWRSLYENRVAIAGATVGMIVMGPFQDRVVRDKILRKLPQQR